MMQPQPEDEPELWPEGDPEPWWPPADEPELWCPVEDIDLEAALDLVEDIELGLARLEREAQLFIFVDVRAKLRTCEDSQKPDITE